MRQKLMGHAVELGIELKDGQRLEVRPITPSDTQALVELGKRSSREDLRLRFFSFVKPVEGPLATRLSHVDPDHEVALAAYEAQVGGKDEFLGVVRLVDCEEPRVGEFAILVRSDAKRRGIGRELIKIILELAKQRGLERVVGVVLAENQVMLTLLRQLGGRVESHGPSPGVVSVAFDLAGQAVKR
jgi:acetyltransferase